MKSRPLLQTGENMGRTACANVLRLSCSETAIFPGPRIASDSDTASGQIAGDHSVGAAETDRGSSTSADRTNIAFAS
jgi:hypothetical protein